jgi:dihydroorotase
VKLYPAGATTNSDAGVTDLKKCAATLARMEKLGLPLLVHGEVTDPAIDIFDREAVFIERVLDPIRRDIPGLRVVMEHITTKEGADYVREGGPDIAATITTHHLVINRNHILAGGIRPHYYCLPVAKRETHRLALRAAATSGDPSYFLGTDSAPHVDPLKEAPCGCAGIFTATNTLSILAEVFEQEGALDRLEGFVSLHGPRFYRLPVNDETITLRKGEPVPYPAKIETGDGPVTVFDPGFPLHWRVEA